jgi:hypothetical protein
MKFPCSLVAVLVTLTLSACSTIGVTTDYDQTAAFGTYRTYSIAPDPESQPLPEYCEIVLRKTVRFELAARGVTEAEGTPPDLAIAWYLVRSSRNSAQERTDPEGNLAYAYGGYTYWTGIPANLANTTKYPEGTLILDVIDVKTHTLVFRGTATAVAMGPERSGPLIEKAVKKMVAALPKT